MRALAAETPTEYEVKAVFLYQFTQFVSWPEAAFPGRDAPFVMGLVGNDPSGRALQSIVSGESVGRHRLTVEKINDVTAGFRCQILYFTEAGESLIDLRRLRTAPVLTVGGSDSFYRNGGMIQFFLDRRRVRMKVNLAEARAHSLEVSAKLLRIAEVTECDPIRIGTYAMDATHRRSTTGGVAKRVRPEPLSLPMSGPVAGMRLAQNFLAGD